jgi:hypothetical protein
MRSEARSWRRGGWIGAVLGVAITAGLSGCPGPGETQTQDQVVEPVELPPMSEGTLQVLGPHICVAETRLVPGEGSERRARTERIELRWQDRQHYHLRRWVDGERHSEEIREEEWGLVRKGDGPFMPGAAMAGSEVLRDTMVPGNRMLGEVEPAAVLREEPREDDTAPRRFVLELRSELAVEDAAAREDLERRYAEFGATMLPVSVDGEITTDEHGNRTRMRVAYGYRVTDGPGYGAPVIEKIHEESRELAPGGVDLEIPAEAAVWLAEVRSQRAAATSSTPDHPAR